MAIDPKTESTEQTRSLPSEPVRPSEPDEILEQKYLGKWPAAGAEGLSREPLRRKLMDILDSMYRDYQQNLSMDYSFGGFTVDAVLREVEAYATSRTLLPSEATKEEKS